MKSNSFGLDIGTSSIKVAWLNRENNIISYGSALSVPTPVESMQSESAFGYQEMAQVINKLVIDAKITTNNVNISLPENHVYTKVIEMPLLSDSELSTAIYWEAEQYIPAPLDTVTLAWAKLKELRNSFGEERMQVLLVGAPTQLIKRYQKILDLSGLTIIAIETEILSLIRSIVSGDNFPTSLIMNIGAMSSSLCIVRNGVIAFNYTISLGGVALTRTIASDFGFNLAQAEEYKVAYGLLDTNFEGKIAKAIDPVLSSMLAEVKKVMLFHNEAHKNESPISQIILTGGSAALPGLAVYFAKALGVETITGNPWKMLGVKDVPKTVEEKGTEYAVAIGLALKEYE